MKNSIDICLLMLVLAVPVAHAAPITLGQGTALGPVSMAASNQIDDALRRANEALRAGRLDTAEAGFNEARKLNEMSPQPLVGLAMVAKSRGRGAEAREHMQKAVTLAPEHAGILKAYAVLLIELKDKAAAQEVYRRAIAANPKSLEMKIDQAELYQSHLEQPAEALRVLRELNRTAADSTAVQMALGRVLAAQGKLPEATQALNAAVKLEPQNPTPLFELAVMQLKAGKAEAAMAAFDRLLTLRPNQPQALLGKAVALASLDRVEQALAIYVTAASVMPGNATADVARAQLLGKKGRLDEAEAAYREALRVEPGQAIAQNNLAQLLVDRKGNLSDALQLIEKAIATDPAQASFADTLGQVRRARGELDLARQGFEKALTLAPGNRLYRQHLDALPASVATIPPPAKSVATAPAPAPAPVVAPAPPAPVAPVAAVAPVVPPAAKVAAAVAAVPVAAPALAKPPVVDAGKAVTARLDGWLKAWQAKDVTAYLDFYSPAFTSVDKGSRKAWEADRRAKLAKPGPISVQISNPSVTTSAVGVSVIFEQKYVSGNYSDQMKKQLDWVQEDGQWRIVRELKR